MNRTANSRSHGVCVLAAANDTFFALALPQLGAMSGAACEFLTQEVAWWFLHV
jgi:hypothetical protein